MNNPEGDESLSPNGSAAHPTFRLRERRIEPAKGKRLTREDDEDADIDNDDDDHL